jgi:Uncharacterized conserved protein (DUF2183)
MESRLARASTFGGTYFSHTLHETDDERKFRASSKFPACEAKMGIPLLSRRKASMLDTTMSLLGSYNPFVKQANPKEHSVWLLDNTAWRPQDNRPWQAKFTAAYFIRDSGDDMSEAVAAIAGLLGIVDDKEKEATIAERLQPFLDTILPAHYCSISVGKDGAVHRMPPSNFDGISYAMLQLPGHRSDGQTTTSKVVEVADAIPCTTTFAATDGWAVISDIDDTIKKTLTGSPTGILSTTFVEEPEPIAGMPDFYAHIAQRLQNPPFWYLSASPYNLYQFLRAFREAHYPPGTLLLRETSMMNLGAFLLSLTTGVEDFKTGRMDVIHASFPGRKMVCVGDSTQSDPEAYAKMYTKYPGWVRAIFIRRVRDVAELDEAGKNSVERFQKAFEKVPKEVWHVFDDPKELYGRLDEVLETDGDAK